MRLNKYALFLTFLIVLSAACSFLTGIFPGIGGGATPGAEAPLVVKGNGPVGLTAEATSADTVKLTWQAVEGATSYHIAVNTDGGDTFPVMNLDPSRTSYEDFLAMPGSQLKYAVEALADSGSIGQSVVEVTTPERQPNPLTVDAQLDINTTAAASIGPEGGSISLTDGRGVAYKLDIPAGALDSPTNIRLTAVKNIGGWPLEGDMLGAVKIEPDGFVLNDLATLSITLPKNQPVNNLLNLGFAFSGNGTEFHLKPVHDQKAGTGLVPGDSRGGHLSSPVKQNGAEIVMETLVMYGVGIGEGSAETAGSLVKNNAPTDAGAALQQKEAAVISSEGDELAPLVYINPYESILINMIGDVYKTIGDAQDCRDVRSAIGSVTGWLSEAKFRNLDPAQIQRGRETMVKDLADKIKKTIDDAAEKCRQKGGPSKSSPPGTGCAQGLIRSVSAGSTQLFKDIQQQMIKDYGTSALTDPDGELRKCTKKFSVNAPAGDIVFSGSICSLEETFYLGISGAAAGGATFTPSTKIDGTVIFYAAGGGVSFDAVGTYNIEGIDSDAPVMNIKVAEVSHTPMGDFSHDLAAGLPLVPIESGDCK